jgi:hypothetical protein
MSIYTHCNEPDYYVSPHHNLGADKYPPNLRQEGLLLGTTESTTKQLRFTLTLSLIIVKMREKSHRRVAYDTTA